jgi:hypothetical protein
MTEEERWAADDRIVQMIAALLRPGMTHPTDAEMWAADLFGTALRNEDWRCRLPPAAYAALPPEDEA